MKQGGTGGANTRTGLVFEKDVDLRAALERVPTLTIDEHKILRDGSEIGLLLAKNALYTQLLEQRRIEWKRIVSKKILPDDCVYSLRSKILTVIEKKWQQVEGSVDEKLQTCDFKRKQYQKLVEPLGARAQYFYVLGDWFKNPKYKDVLEYIREMNCDYFFAEIPLERLHLSI
jgi:hypothetical protein